MVTVSTAGCEGWSKAAASSLSDGQFLASFLRFLGIVQVADGFCICHWINWGAERGRSFESVWWSVSCFSPSILSALCWLPVVSDSAIESRSRVMWQLLSLSAGWFLCFLPSVLLQNAGCSFSLILPLSLKVRVRQRLKVLMLVSVLVSSLDAPA